MPTSVQRGGCAHPSEADQQHTPPQATVHPSVNTCQAHHITLLSYAKRGGCPQATPR